MNSSLQAKRPSVPSELVARLEVATGNFRATEAWDFAEKYAPWWGTSSAETHLFVDALQGSLDAALALAERVLPGWAFVMATVSPPWVQAHPQPLDEDNYQDAVAAATLPLAICIAILRAVQHGE